MVSACFTPNFHQVTENSIQVRGDTRAISRALNKTHSNMSPSGLKIARAHVNAYELKFTTTKTCMIFHYDGKTYIGLSGYAHKIISWSVIAVPALLHHVFCSSVDTDMARRHQYWRVQRHRAHNETPDNCSTTYLWKTWRFDFTFLPPYASQAVQAFDGKKNLFSFMDYGIQQQSVRTLYNNNEAPTTPSFVYLGMLRPPHHPPRRSMSKLLW